MRVLRWQNVRDVCVQVGSSPAVIEEANKLWKRGQQLVKRGGERGRLNGPVIVESGVTTRAFYNLQEVERVLDIGKQEAIIRAEGPRGAIKRLEESMKSGRSCRSLANDLNRDSIVSMYNSVKAPGPYVPGVRA